MRRSAYCGGVLLVAALCGGCRERPRAPLLRDEPVYHDAKQHIRFLAPEGWTQHAKSDLPAGPIDSEHLLVDYMHWTGDMPALLSVSVVDLPEGTDLPAYLTRESFGARRWELLSGGEQVEAGGQTGQRFVLQTHEHGDRTKEVAVFRRGRRVFFFTGLYGTGDEATRDQIRRAIKSTVWD